MARKIFVGSLPQGITEDELRREFETFGEVEEVFIKEKCPAGKQWAFITYVHAEDAQTAKETTDTKLRFPDSDRPCDVMLAKNQGLNGSAGPTSPTSMPVAEAPRKIFVGSLPDGIEAETVRREFGRYGLVEELFLKQGCEPGRQWGFVTFSSHEEAQAAQEQTNGVLTFDGSIRPCQVTLARNQGLYGNGSIKASVPVVDTGPKKIFVGTLPDDISEDVLMDEFSKYGEVKDVFLKPNCESGRHWGFVTFATSQQALDAKESCDRTLMLPGSTRPCEVTIARHQGLYGQDGDGDGGRRQETTRGSYSQGGSYSSSYDSYGGGRQTFSGSGIIYASSSYGGSHSSAKRPAVIGAVDSMVSPARSTKGGQDRNGYAGGYGTERSERRSQGSHPYERETQSTTSVGGPCKIFVGSLPDGCPEDLVRQEFSKYGRITDVYMKQGCEPGRQWAFVIYSSAEEAKMAKESTDKILELPGSTKPCEVMLAKNQGMYGQAPLRDFHHGGGGMAGQPPPPSTPPPPHLTPWRTYKTQSGLPYYHNSKTGQTVWECPTEFEPPPGNVPAANGKGGAPRGRASPY